MDIEDRAEKWARKRVDEVAAHKGIHCMILSLKAMAEALTEAYLAGSAQTQADYTAPQPPTTGSSCDRHSGQPSCPRCVCTCGAR